MTNVAITNTRMPRDIHRNSLSVLTPSSNEEVDGTSASAQSTEFTEESIVLITADALVRIAFGVDPTASASTMPLPSGVPMYFRVPAGWKIAVQGGVADITTME